MRGNDKHPMCRLCLAEGVELLGVFESKGIPGWTAADAISELLQIQVSEGDIYPHHVCNECMGKLLDFKLFKNQCESNKGLLDNTHDRSRILGANKDLNSSHGNMFEDSNVKIKEEVLDVPVESHSDESLGEGVSRITGDELTESRANNCFDTPKRTKGCSYSSGNVIDSSSSRSHMDESILANPPRDVARLTPKLLNELDPMDTIQQKEKRVGSVHLSHATESRQADILNNEFKVMRKRVKNAEKKLAKVEDENEKLRLERERLSSLNMDLQELLLKRLNKKELDETNGDAFTQSGDEFNQNGSAFIQSGDAEEPLVEVIVNENVANERSTLSFTPEHEYEEKLVPAQGINQDDSDCEEQSWQPPELTPRKMLIMKSSTEPSKIVKHLMPYYWTTRELADRCPSGKISNAHKNKSAKRRLSPVKVKHLTGVFEEELRKRGKCEVFINEQRKKMRQWMQEKCKHAAKTVNKSTSN